LESIDNNQGSYYHFSLQNTTLIHEFFTPINQTFPAGFLLNEATDFDGDGNFEIVLSKYDSNNSFGPIEIYEFDGIQFQKRLETSFTAIPRAWGDSDNDGKKELLLGFGRFSFLLEAAQPNEFPTQVVWSDTNDFWAAALSDLDKDGRGEIIGSVEDQYRVFESVADNSFAEKFTFLNSTEGTKRINLSYKII